MIEVLDRIPTYPGRVKLIPVAGQENTYDMVRADSPTETGTPINRALFQSIEDDLAVLRANLSDIINSHASKSLLASVPAGTEFVLFEGGVRVPFIKLAGEYGGTGRSLVVRKNIYKKETMTTSGQSNEYTNCKTDTWLNNETSGYLSKLDEPTRAAIVAVPVLTNLGSGSYVVETIQRKAFLLSATELGVVRSDIIAEGTKIDYFSVPERRAAQFEGAAAEYWTRTPQYPNDNWSYLIGTSGLDFAQNARSYVAGIRPAFTLPSDFEVDLSVPDTGNTMATSEVI